jgi:uncharacterized phage protein (TIGR02218 family)
MPTQTELYRISEQGTGTVWTYTSGNEEIVHNAETYEPIAVSRTEVQNKIELARANIDVNLSLTNPLAIRCLETNGERIMTITVYERDRQGDISVIWKGRLASVLPGMTNVALKMESIFTSLRRYGLRAKYTRSCRHALYGRGCNLNPEDFAILGCSVSAASGRTLTIVAADAYEDGYFTGGMLRTADGMLSYIIGHTGSAIKLQRQSRSLYDEIQDGLPFNVTLYPGCDHTIGTCDTKFNNKLNCGCFRHIPKKNPMGGSSIV